MSTHRIKTSFQMITLLTATSALVACGGGGSSSGGSVDAAKKGGVVALDANPGNGKGLDKTQTGTPTDTTTNDSTVTEQPITSDPVYVEEPVDTIILVEEPVVVDTATPETATPETTTPEVTTPEVTTPEVTTPDIPVVTDPEPIVDSGDISTLVTDVTVDASQSTCVTPCGVFVSAEGLSNFDTDRPFHDLSYQWQFGDTTSYFQSLPTDFKFGRSADTANGPKAAHVYSVPGTYTITVDVAEKSSGKHATATKVITVQSADIVYSGDQTLCVSKVSNFSGCPSGAQQFSDINNALVEFGTSGPKRLLLKAGETYVPTTDSHGQVIVLSGSSYSQRQVNRFGAGLNPVISVVTAASKVFVFEKLDSVQIANIDFQGDYDAATGYGESWACHLVDPKETTNLTFYRNSVSGFGGTTYAAAGANLIYADNVVTNWHDIGFFTSGRDVDGDGLAGDNLSPSAYEGKVPAQEPTDFPQNTAFIGNSIKQKVDAIMNMGGKGGELPRASDHGPIRVAGAYGLVIQKNDMLSTAGWSSVPQPTIRYNTSGPMFHSGIISENRLEGGNWNISASPANSAIKANIGDLIIERNTFKGGDGSRVMIAMSYGGSTIRNNYFLLPGAGEISNAEQYRAMIELGMQDTTVENAAVPVFIGGNTMINLYPVTVDYSPILDRWHVGNFYLPHVEVDNLNYAPYATEQLYTVDPELDATLAPQSIVFKGGAMGDDRIFDTLWGHVRASSSSVGVEN